MRGVSIFVNGTMMKNCTAWYWEIGKQMMGLGYAFDFCKLSIMY